MNRDRDARAATRDVDALFTPDEPLSDRSLQPLEDLLAEG